jgi:hypothetical protein
MTGDWPSRVSAFALPYLTIDDVFDLDRSRAFLVGGNKEEVLRRELGMKKQFAHCRVDARSHEWFGGDVTEAVLEAAASFAQGKSATWQTLGEALKVRRECDERFQCNAPSQNDVDAGSLH